MEIVKQLKVKVMCFIQYTIEVCEGMNVFPLLFVPFQFLPPLGFDASVFPIVTQGIWF